MLKTYTTTPIELTDSIEDLLSPLKLIKLPVHEFAMMMTIALRFIPTLVEETEKIMTAQKARGVDFTSGSIVKRARALIPILIPLFVSSFNRASDLATAMECRCYHGGEGRTKMKLLRYTRWDFEAYLVGVILLAGVITLAVFGL
jgi:energy-coupling factor transport system permease protein